MNGRYHQGRPCSRDAVHPVWDQIDYTQPQWLTEKAGAMGESLLPLPDKWPQWAYWGRFEVVYPDVRTIHCGRTMAVRSRDLGVWTGIPRNAGKTMFALALQTRNPANEAVANGTHDDYGGRHRWALCPLSDGCNPTR